MEPKARGEQGPGPPGAGSAAESRPGAAAGSGTGLDPESGGGAGPSPGTAPRPGTERGAGPSPASTPERAGGGAGPGPWPGLRERLWNGETLRVLLAEGVGFDVWVEKYGNPPQVFSEGRPWPLDAFDLVLERLAPYLAEEGVRLSWNAPIPTKRDRPGA